MRVVGIDQSYTGFGYSVDGGAKKKAFPLSKYPGEIERLDAVYNWFYGILSAALREGGVDLLVMEGYANGAKFGRELAGELGGVVKLTAFDLLGSGKILIVPPTSLKKFVTGKGNAKKNEMLLGVYKQWGHSFADDNVADAYSLEQFGKAYLYLQEGKDPELYPLFKYQVDAIQAVRAKA